MGASANRVWNPDVAGSSGSQVRVLSGTPSVYKAVVRKKARTMSDDPVAEYNRALQAREAAIAEVERMVQTIADGANKLRNWQDVSVSDLRPAVSFPAGRTRIITGDQWPTGQQIGETLKAYHDAGEQARNAWSRVGPEQKGALLPPPAPYE